MTKASIGLQELRRKIYLKAKAEPAWRFWGLFVHGRQGFGWKRWSSAWIRETLGVFSDYRLVHFPEYESVSSR